MREQQIDAIFEKEKGVLRPLEPLSFPDQARVRITVDDQSNPDALDILVRQQEALDELAADVDKISMHQNKDGWSVKDHDDVLYGPRK